MLASAAKPRVLMVLEHPYPPDIRVRKEASALQAAGFGVDLLCPARPGEPADAALPELRAHRHRVPAGAARASRLVRGATGCDPLWTARIVAATRAFRPVAVHVHDLPLVGAALAARRLTGAPVVADLHENYPAAISAWAGERPSFRDRLLGGSRRWTRREPRLLRAADAVVVVVEEAATRVGALGVPAARVAVVSNGESPAFWPLAEGDLARGEDGALMFGYVGGFGPHRGLDCAVRGVALAARHAPELRLRLIGARGGYAHELTSLVRDLGVGERVSIEPWVDEAEVPSLLRAIDVGLVPHHSNAHTEATVPHKLFQYMLHGRPVLVSDCAPLARITRAAGAGLVFRAGDAASFAAAALELRERELRARLGRAGREAASGPFAWERSAEVLVGVHERLAAGRWRRS